jgi:hypothetical protein
MKASTFNFGVALWCAGVAAFAGLNSVDPFIVGLNIVLALGNLIVGVLLHKQGG